MSNVITWAPQQMRLSDLVKWPDNPRYSTEADAEHLATSIDKFGQALPLLVSPEGDLYDGHQRLGVMALMYRDGPAAVVDVRVSSRALTHDERRELVIRLHENTGQWDFDGLADLYELDELKAWGFSSLKLGISEGVSDWSTMNGGEVLDHVELDLPEGVPDTLWPSSNEWGIPDLDPGRQANAYDLPMETWGARQRGTVAAGTLHFYTEDYRFTALWDNPAKLLAKPPINVAEPNFSVYDQAPLAQALWQTYKKRWLARYWQSQGVRIFVDLNVARPYDDINLIGVPAGWQAYATRGYTNRLQALDDELKIAKKHAGSSDILFLVYGGGIKIKAWCDQHSAVWIPEDMDRAKGKYLKEADTSG